MEQLELVSNIVHDAHSHASDIKSLLIDVDVFRVGNYKAMVDTEAGVSAIDARLLEGRRAIGMTKSSSLERCRRENPPRNR